jgi:DNA-binding MarR family transcriptional regulator
VADSVDRIVAAWARERPDLPVDRMEVWSRVTRLSRLLDRERSRAFAQHGLEGWEFDVLAALRRSGKPYQLSPGQLLVELEVSSGTMTNRISRLSARGLVIRRPHPVDGRSALVGLTGKGMEVVDGALSALLESEGRLLHQIDPRDVERLGAGLRAVLGDQEIRSTAPAGTQAESGHGRRAGRGHAGSTG